MPRKLTRHLSVYASPAEDALIRAAAKAQGITISELARQALTEKLAEVYAKELRT